MAKLSIIKQAYKKVQEFKGAEAEVFHADVPEYYLPDKKDVYTKMEALIYHFKIIMGETEMPAGEIYSAVEGANGELGFYLISDGGRRLTGCISAGHVLFITRLILN